MHTLFVYGALKQGERIATLLDELATHERRARITYVGPDVVEGYTIMGAGWVAVARPAPGRRIQGEVIRVDRPTFNQIELIEQGGYDRLPVVTANGVPVDMYVGKDAYSRWLVEHGEVWTGVR